MKRQNKMREKGKMENQKNKSLMQRQQEKMDKRKKTDSDEQNNVEVFPRKRKNKKAQQSRKKIHQMRMPKTNKKTME